MSLMFTVQGDTRAETEAALQDLCAKNDLVPYASGRVHEIPGRGGRWMARAVPAADQQWQPGRTCTAAPDGVR